VKLISIDKTKLQPRNKKQVKTLKKKTKTKTNKLEELCIINYKPNKGEEKLSLDI